MRGPERCIGRSAWKVAFPRRPCLPTGELYFVNEAGVTYVVNADTTYELLATNDLDEETLASPAVTDGAIFLRTAEHLWRIGE